MQVRLNTEKEKSEKSFRRQVQSPRDIYKEEEIA